MVSWTFVAALAQVQQEATVNRDSGAAASVYRTYYIYIYAFVVPGSFVAALAQVRQEATENGCLGI